jgi:hypothetical protein
MHIITVRSFIPEAEKDYKSLDGRRRPLAEARSTRRKKVFVIQIK